MIICYLSEQRVTQIPNITNKPSFNTHISLDNALNSQSPQMTTSDSLSNNKRAIISHRTTFPSAEGEVVYAFETNSRNTLTNCTTNLFQKTHTDKKAVPTAKEKRYGTRYLCTINQLAAAGSNLKGEVVPIL